MSELERLREEYDAAVKRRHGKIGATGLEIRADALRAALEAENERLRVAITKLYRSPLLDESGYHERGEDIPEDVWDACEVIRQVLTPRPTEGGE
jgi:hypothetical protein